MPERSPSRSSLPTILGLAGLLFSATSAGITRQLVEELGSFQLLAVQFSISSVLLLALHGIRRRGWRDLLRLPPRYLWPCMAAFLVCLTCFSGAYLPLLRAAAGDRKLMVLAYCDADEAYIPTRAIRQEGGYEGVIANYHFLLRGPFTEAVEETLLGAIPELWAGK